MRFMQVIMEKDIVNITISKTCRYIFFIKSHNIIMMKNILEYIKSKCEKSNDVYFRKIKVDGEVVDLIFCESVTNTDLISNFVVRSLVECIKINDKEQEKKDKEKLTLKQQILSKLEDRNINLDELLAINKIEKIDVFKEDIFKYLYSGFCIIIYSEDVYIVETKANLNRGITEPSSENSIKGAKDAFNENIMNNIGLVRNRIKSDKLFYEEYEVGRKTKTKVGVVYVSDIAKKEVVERISKKINEIDIDGILDVNYIQELLEEKNESDFPVSISTQRPDLVSHYLLQGRIAIFVNNCPFVVVVPAFFKDFVNNIDDLYQRAKTVTITKIVRYLSLIITIVTPALYISLISFDQESIPTALLKSFATQREGVPFPAFFEAAMMILAFEILRESDMRSNKVSGNTLSIVGALILGDAAVSAGIVSPIMIIVVAITTISGLMFSDINVVNALRKWRLTFMIFASLCGIIGIGMAFVFMACTLVDTKSYSFPFTYPVSPLNITEVKKNLFSRIKISRDNKRQKILTNNLTKSR